MIQDILTILIIGGALAYTGYNIFRALGNAKRKKSTCGGCSGCSTKEKCDQVEQVLP